MSTCTNCQTANADGSKFCKQCGQPLDTGVGDAAAPDATVHWSGPLRGAPGVGEPVSSSELTIRWAGRPVSDKPSPRRAIEVATLFGAKDRIVIGRAADCDVCLSHPMVSRYHALLERRPEGLRLRDLASVNGVSVAGHRIAEPVFVPQGVPVGIGPFLFSLSDGVIHTVDSSRSLRLEARQLEKVIRLPDGKPRKLLDNINLVVNPGEFVTLLGPSGSGKSTLMDCLNGRRRATGGKVLANGEDFYRHFDNFRQSLGYVPQKDIVHTQLTVHRALYYTAQLRLPTDTNPAELKARIESVIKEMELGPHRDTLVANLSGGQIKRVSLGAELLAQPCMLYIDEATSGLDAGTESRMMQMFRRLADEGRSLICITHNVDNVERCHLVLVLARGKLMFYGPPAEAPRYFKVNRISEIYDRLTERDVESWEKEFTACSLYQEFVADRLAASAPEPAAPEGVSPPAPPKSAGPLSESRRPAPSSQGLPLAEQFRALTSRALRLRALLTPLTDQWHQFRVLTARYVELIFGDRRGLRLLLLQAPIVAAFLLVGFVHKDYQARVSPLDALLNKDGDLKPEVRDSLASVTVEVEGGDQRSIFTGEEFLALYHTVRGKLAEAEARIPEEARYTVRLNGKDITLSSGSATEVLRELFRVDRLNPRYTYMLLFILVTIVLWFGCNNAAKEIVKEEAIYGR
jgi:ABC-type multidrug transport system ATPase subunit